jgi:serine/threonine protein phosphatase PrpC
MRLVSWSGTDTGKKRELNEDSLLADDPLRLWAVADGMGGHKGGDRASRLALEVLRREIAASAGDLAGAAATILAAREGRITERLDLSDAATAQPTAGRPSGGARMDAARSGPTPGEAGERTESDDDVALRDTLDGDEIAALMAGSPPARDQRPPVRDKTERMFALVTQPAAEIVMAAAARRAGSEIYEAAQADEKFKGMGTTLSAVLHHEGCMHYVHAGDSRIYLFRDGRIRQVTEDHSWIWQQVKLGAMSEEEARVSKFRHIVTRSVGFERHIEVDTGAVPLQAGDCFLLCSDGLSNYLSARELERVLATTWYRLAPRTLIDMANARGGDDNITVVVVYAANEIDSAADDR